MSKFKFGDAVVLSKEGKAAYTDGPANPHGSVGVVERPALGSHDWFVVTWDNGKSNVYLLEQLAPYVQPDLNLGKLCRNIENLQRKLARAVEIYNDELARQQAKLGSPINLQLLADIDEARAMVNLTETTA